MSDRFPHKIKPMLAVLADKAFDDPAWIFEIKWDGFRAIAEIRSSKVDLYSRNQISLNEDFPQVVQALKKVRHDAVLDGEIVALDKKGISRFQLLQRNGLTQARLAYVVFDILYLDGRSLTSLPLLERKKLLKKILPRNRTIVYGDYLTGKGKAFFAKAKKIGLEGIMGKRADSTYQMGVRGSDWLKFKTKMRQETVIAGFTAPQGSRTGFGSLVLGVYEKGKLVFVGHCGTGFDEDTLKMLMKKMKPLITAKPPFSEKVPTKSPITWLRPKLVCEIEFGEWTNEMHMRVPVFVGMRTDKPAKDVVFELPKKRRTK